MRASSTLGVGRPVGLYYSHSGTVPLAAGLAGVVVGLVAGTAAAVAYAYADLYSPLIYGNFLLCAGFGFCLGYVPAYAMRKGKARNVGLTMILVFAITLISYYIVWPYWIYAVDQRFNYFIAHKSANFMLFHPDWIWIRAKILNTNGTWSISHSGSSSEHPENVSGIFLSIIWLTEIASIFFIALYTAKSVIADHPFCEKCDQWCIGDKVIGTLGPASADEFRSRLESRDWNFIRTQAAIPRSNTWIELSLHTCDRCGKLCTISAKSVTATRAKKAKKDTITRKLIVDKLLFSPEEVASLRAAMQPPPAPAGPVESSPAA